MGKVFMEIVKEGGYLRLGNRAVFSGKVAFKQTWGMGRQETWKVETQRHIFQSLLTLSLNTVMILTVWWDELMVKGYGKAHWIPVTLPPFRCLFLDVSFPSLPCELLSSCYLLHLPLWAPSIQTLLYSSSPKEWLESFLRSNIGRSNESGSFHYKWQKNQLKVVWPRKEIYWLP